MSEEKIVYILNANILLTKPSVFLSIQAHDPSNSISHYINICSDNNLGESYA